MLDRFEDGPMEKVDDAGGEKLKGILTAVCEITVLRGVERRYSARKYSA